MGVCTVWMSQIPTKPLTRCLHLPKLQRHSTLSAVGLCRSDFKNPLNSGKEAFEYWLPILWCRASWQELMLDAGFPSCTIAGAAAVVDPLLARQSVVVGVSDGNIRIPAKDDSSTLVLPAIPGWQLPPSFADTVPMAPLRQAVSFTNVNTITSPFGLPVIVQKTLERR